MQDPAQIAGIRELDPRTLRDIGLAEEAARRRLGHAFRSTVSTRHTPDFLP